MSSFLSELGGITGGVGAEGVAFAAGFAASHALAPEADLIAQASWHAAEVRRLEAMLAARAAAQGLADEATMAEEASYTGYDATRFAYMYNLALTAPGAGELLNMLRRGTVTQADFTHGLRKSSLEPRWDVPIADLANVYIGIGDIATAIVRGAVPAPAWVPVAPPVTTDHVPRFPVTNIDPIALAGKLGYSEDMLKIMTARSGLSLAPILATQANFRGALTDNDWLLAIAEGDLRTEWASTLKEAARAIPSPGEEMEAALRGWQTKAQAEAGAARHGMTPADADLLYEIKRRPLNVHAITTGLARGGVFDASQAPMADPYEASVHEADLGPEWYDLAIANKYVYPSVFAIRTLAQAGELGDTAAVEQLLLELGWKPDLAAKVAKVWAPTGTAAGPHATKAETHLWGTTHSAYKNGEIGQTDAAANLTTLGISTAEQADVFTYWNAERATIRKQLSVAQLQKAEKDGLKNPATGQPFTANDVIAALVDRGYSQADAQTLAAGA